jgi:predicted dehydrogenase
MARKKYAIVGAGGRAKSMFAKPIATTFKESAELVAICDVSQVHMDYYNTDVLPSPVPTYKSFDRMVKEVPFDTLIVTTRDRFHSDYIVKGLKAGKNVITEKPMTIDEKRCRAILDAEKKSRKKVTVTFNYRWAPPATLIHNLVQAGELGDVVTVDMHWPLDLRHGASYFRRWHSHREFSGGLQIHKSTHHFDLVNWMINDVPEKVSAQGGLDFYGKAGPFRNDKCRGCPHQKKCQFYIDIRNWEFNNKFYIPAEKETGYIFDQCVFHESINVEDNYQVMVQYKGGARLAYSLQAFAEWEGYRLEIQGTTGRLEYLERHDTHDWEAKEDVGIVVMKKDGSRQVHTPPKGEGGHGGGDLPLQRALFEGGKDPYGRLAGAQAGANSILVGVAATKSMQNNNAWVKISDLLKG